MFRPFLVLFGLLLAAPLAACAQTAPASTDAPPAASAPTGAPGAVAHHPNRYRAALRALNLSDDQRAQIAGFMRDARTANQNADPQTRRANAKKLRQQIAGVLTPDQRVALRAALRRRAGAGGPNTPTAVPLPSGPQPAGPADNGDAPGR